MLYDALVAGGVVELAPRAQRFFVGKRAGRHAMTQEAIHRLMIRAAARGQRVVRLKGGDPFVFGRGGEEALALRGAGSAVRGRARRQRRRSPRPRSPAFPSRIAASRRRSSWSPATPRPPMPVLDSVAPHAATVVVLMGLATRAAVARPVARGGLAGATPAAIVFGAGHAAAHAWTGRLDGLSGLTVADQCPARWSSARSWRWPPLIGGAVNLPAASAGEELERQGRG